MNVNSKVITALSTIGIPVSANVYTGTATEYIVFNYADERPSVYADNIDILDEVTIQVHYYTKGNPSQKKKSIRDKLRENGFTIKSVQEMYESETKDFHVVIYAWIEGAVE